MKRKLYIALFLSFIVIAAYSQQSTTTINGYMVPVCVYKGDTIPSLRLPNVYVFKPLKFKNEKERREYYRLVRNVKKTLPLARAINRAIIETYEYLATAFSGSRTNQTMRKEDLMMKFRKNQNKEKQIPKEKKPRVYYKVNPHKKVVIALWVLLGLSFSFAIFKHLTAWQIPGARRRWCCRYLLRCGPRT